MGIQNILIALVGKLMRTFKHKPETKEEEPILRFTTISIDVPQEIYRTNASSFIFTTPGCISSGTMHIDPSARRVFFDNPPILQPNEASVN